MTSPRRYYGEAGHFCAANSCRFHLHTHVNGFCVSTVGEYYPPPLKGFPAKRADGMEEIGLRRFYETMVFPIDDQDNQTSLTEEDFAAYNDRHEANEGHERMVQKYEALT